MESTATELRQELEALAEPAYRDFAAALIPGIDSKRMLGVRLPRLRRIAKKLAGEGILRLPVRRKEYFEETMVRGMLPGYAERAAYADRLAALEAFVPSISNWSLCDSCCVTCSFVRKEREKTWEWLQSFLGAGQEYVARFGIVMLLNHFVQEEEWVPRLSQALGRVQASGHYAAMAAAWCACELLLRHPQAEPLLADRALRDDIRTLTLRKLRESRRKMPPANR